MASKITINGETLFEGTATPLPLSTLQGKFVKILRNNLVKMGHSLYLVAQVEAGHYNLICLVSGNRFSMSCEGSKTLDDFLGHSSYEVLPAGTKINFVL